jgi:hypothetical protein
MSQIRGNRKKLVGLIVHERLDIFVINGRLVAVIVHEKLLAVVVGRHQQASPLLHLLASVGLPLLLPCRMDGNPLAAEVRNSSSSVVLMHVKGIIE